MDKDEKIKLAITSGIISVILLLLVGILVVTDTKGGKNKKQSNDTAEHAVSSVSGDAGAGASEQNGSAADDSSSAASSEEIVLSYSEYLDPAPGSVSGNSFYATKTAVLKDVYKDVEYDKEEQLKEMQGYWAENNMAAVRDLAHLERYEAMSYELGDGNDFLYYGETNDSGNPEGKGLAVYGNSCYYYGDWVNGVRQGEGSWINFYPSYSHYVVTEHTFSGNWENDLPTGKGQEHYDYNAEYMNPEDVYLQNAMGGFKDGKYNGDMYVIIINAEGNATEWRGTCKEGKWARVLNGTKDKKGNIPVLSLLESEDTHVYMSQEALADNGISGIVSGGKPINK
ncbi:MAG: hypothetical protein J5802_11430 [Butyrivibrio sp.]|nr:hypothetical protein [Butyrivibrio sp.]